MNQTKPFSNCFTIRKRFTGEHFVHLKDDAPQCLQDLVREIHTTYFYYSLPDDWIYETIENAFDRLEECETDNEMEREMREIEPEVMTVNLCEWAKAGYAQAYIQEAVNDFGAFSEFDTMVQQGQRVAMERIYVNVWNFLKQQRKA